VISVKPVHRTLQPVSSICHLIGLINRVVSFEILNLRY